VNPPEIKVLSPGAYTSVQDAGRAGHRKMGVPVSGALDRFSYTVANHLVGNPPDFAVLEITVIGPRLEFTGPADIALTGAEMAIHRNEETISVWRSFRVQAGDVLEIGQVSAGCRAYLAAGGGIDVPVVMGSRSTFAGGKMGGFQGRPLMTGDRLPVGKTDLLPAPRILPEKMIPNWETAVTVRAVPGPQEDYFDTGIDTLFSSEYMVTPKADRMGYRLQGPEIHIREGMPQSIVSEPSLPGGIQIPADRQPIVLFVEQTVGGYCKPATVISPDLPKIAQTTPGDTLRFEKIDLSAAHEISLSHRRRMEEIAALLAR
jgi:biotin-dependent carboxylase-like uncharacterized protein